MSVYGTSVVYGTGFVYGPSTIAFLDNGSQVLRGPIEGGTTVNIVGIALDTSCDDAFVGGIINPAKWTTAVAGSGTAIQNNGVFLSTGIAVNSSATLQSVPTFDINSDLSIAFAIQSDIVRQPPAASVRFFEAELFVDANNYFRVSRVYDTTLPDRHAFRITCVIGGTTVENVIIPDNIQASRIRLVRVKNRVIVMLNSTMIYDDNPFATSAEAQVIFRTINLSLTDGFNTTILLTDFRVSTLTIFDGEPAITIRQDATNLRVSSPAVRTPRLSTISIYACVGQLAELLSVFEYFLDTQFKVLNETGVSVGFLGDQTLRNLQNGRLGFEV